MLTLVLAKRNNVDEISRFLNDGKAEDSCERLAENEDLTTILQEILALSDNMNLKRLEYPQHNFICIVPCY